jgi:Demerecviridae HNH endonuclease
MADLRATAAAVIDGLDWAPVTLTQARLHEVLSYNPNTGLFTWKVGGGRRKVGDIAGFKRYKGALTYVVIGIDDREYYAHQLVYLYRYGRFAELIDHADRIGTNNRPSNLIETDHSINHFNTGMRPDNTSGHRGVSWNSQVGKWTAHIQVRGKSYYLGLFEAIEDAIEARSAAEIRFLGCTVDELQDPRNRKPKPFFRRF